VDILVNNAAVATQGPLVGKWPRQLSVVLVVWVFRRLPKIAKSDR
jgi:hypothetical protein